jgi:hypothetical protein
MASILKDHPSKFFLVYASPFDVLRSVVWTPWLQEFTITGNYIGYATIFKVFRYLGAHHGE